MSAAKRIAFAVTVSWLSRFITILANLFLIPILFHYLGKEELGLWFLLGNSQAFLSLLDMGVAPTLSRQIALEKGKNGADPNVELTQESQEQIGNLVTTGKIILRYLSVVVFFIAWISGYVLITQLNIQTIAPQTVILAWTLMCAGYAIGIWISHLNCLLVGTGLVGLNNMISMLITVLAVLLNISVVIAGGGLLALAIISVITGLIQRIAIIGYIRWRHPSLLKIKGRWESQIAQPIFQASLQSWLTTLGTFLILRTDQYFIAFAIAPEKIPSYQATYQLVSNLRVLAVSFALSSSPFLSQWWQAGDLKKIHSLLIRNSKISLFIMAFGSLFLLFSGKELIIFWLGENVFIGYPILATFCITLLFEVQNVTLMYSARATGVEEYAVSSLSAGFLNFIFTMILVKPLGLWGVALGTFLGQMFTNNWYSLYQSLKRLKLKFYDYYTQVICVVLSFMSFSTILLFFANYILFIFNYRNPINVILIIGILSTVFFSLAVWFSILNISEKKYFFLKLKKTLNQKL